MTLDTTFSYMEDDSREREIIASAKNPKIKALLALQEKSALRRERGLFVVEGRRELERCLRAGFRPYSVFVCPALAKEAEPGGTGTTPATDGCDWPMRLPPCPVFEVTQEVYGKIAYRGSTEGVIAEIKAKQLTLNDIPLHKNPLTVVLEAVEKPGNLGAVLRSADAAGADAVIVCDPLTDLYNPNLIRASMGAAFTVPTVAATSEEAINWLKDNNIKIYTAQLQDSSPYWSADMRGPTAIIMGTEATGLTAQWRKAADAHVRIPMLGVCDSLNVSVSTAILLYEAVRQRRNAQ